MNAFVYCWTDHATNKLYVGSHLGEIDDGYVSSSKYMKNEYQKRPQDFTREVIATGTEPDMRKFESVILKAAGARKSEHFYNKTENDGKFYFSGKRPPFTEEHRAKMSAARKGRKISPEHAAKLHAGRRGKKNTPEHQHAVTSSRIGSKHSEETKLKMRNAKSRVPNLSEIGRKAGLASKKRWEEDPSLKAAHSERMKAWWAERKRP